VLITNQCLRVTSENRRAEHCRDTNLPFDTLVITSDIKVGSTRVWQRATPIEHSAYHPSKAPPSLQIHDLWKLKYTQTSSTALMLTRSPCLYTNMPSATSSENLQFHTIIMKPKRPDVYTITRGFTAEQCVQPFPSNYHQQKKQRQRIKKKGPMAMGCV